MAKFQIEQYFHVSLSLLKLGRAMPFTLHIYLPVNDRIVPLILSGEVYEQRTADLLARRKINEVYILVSDRAAYEEYMKAEGLIPDPMAIGVQEPASTRGTQGTQAKPAIEDPKTPQTQQDAAMPTTPPTTATTAPATTAPTETTATAADETDTSPTENKSVETITPVEVVATGIEPPIKGIVRAAGEHAQSTQLTPPDAAIEKPQASKERPDSTAAQGLAQNKQSAPPKAASPPRASQQSSRKLASEIFGKDPAARERALSTSRKIIRKLLDGATEEEKKLFDVFTKLDEAGGQGYSSSVASYCVLFAMGIGYSDVETLRDLTVASLLHDIGTTQLPPETVWTPRNRQTPDQRREFIEHVRLGKDLLDLLHFKPNARVSALIEAHHEKFDGTGYPKGTRGEKLTELSQVLSFSDFLHSLSTGYLDGTKRSPHESFAYLREIENDPRFPHYFNPNLFRKIIDWVLAGSGGGSATEAA